MRFLKNRESGQALIMALIMLALGSLLVIPGAGLASTSLNYHRNIDSNTMELYAASSGIQYTACELGNGSGAFGPESLSSQVNDRNVTVTAEDMGGNTYKITSTATSADGSSTTIESYLHIKLNLFGKAITVTSGDLVLEGSTIDGDVYAGGEVTVEDSVVTGDITENATYEFDLLDTEPYKTEAQNGGIIEGNLILGAGTHTLGPVYITGYLKIQEGAEVTLGGTVYVEGSEKMEDNITIHLEGGSSIMGAGNFIAEEGDIKIEVSRLEPDNMPLIAAIAGSIKCENCDYIKGLLYAPEISFGIKVEENTEIYGSIFTTSMGVVENCTITYPVDTEGSDLLGGDELQILTYNIN
ncbi:MAG TPA: hypothetical protein VMV84_06710 [Dehalococcoidales bacterium]|nr:hypothetical protein [Dehalococcoidales bacterium]